MSYEAVTELESTSGPKYVPVSVTVSLPVVAKPVVGLRLLITGAAYDSVVAPLPVWSPTFTVTVKSWPTPAAISHSIVVSLVTSQLPAVNSVPARFDSPVFWYVTVASLSSSSPGPKFVPVTVNTVPDPPAVDSVLSDAALVTVGAAYVVTRPAYTPLLLVVVCCPPTVTSHLNDDPTPVTVVQSIRVCEATVHADESRLYVDWPSVLVRPVSVVTYSALTTLFRPSAAGPKFVPRIVTTVDPAVAIVSVSPSRPESGSIFRFVIVGTL